MSNYNCMSSMYVDVMSSSNGVPGSCLYVTVKYPDRTSNHFVVDCGLNQDGKEIEKNPNINRELLFNPENVDFAIVTHNHIDHTGKLPLMVKKGFRGSIYMTRDTRVLLPYALGDTVKIEKSKSKIRNVRPIYGERDVFNTLKLITSLKYNETFIVNENIKITLFENAHLVGAALVLVQISYFNCEDINLLFTGDYGVNNPFVTVKNGLPNWLLNLPINIICESTYGYMNSTEIKQTFVDNVIHFFEDKKNNTLVCPTFSLGRSQEILKVLMQMQEAKQIQDIHIYQDGKLTQAYTKLFLNNALETIDPEKSSFIPENLTIVDKTTRRELSSGILYNQRKIIVSSAGTGSQGPVRNYLQKYLCNPHSLVHITGYPAEGSVNRELVECPDEDTIDFAGLIIPKRAKVQFTNEFSAHAKADELIEFLNKFNCIHSILITHGNWDTKITFSKRVLRQTNAKNVGILSREYFFRLDNYGIQKTLSTHYM